MAFMKRCFSMPGFVNTNPGLMFAAKLRSRAAGLMFLCLFLTLPQTWADYYAAKNGQTPVAPYTSWSAAASNIQEAVNAAPAGSTVWVGAGRYTVPPNPTNYGWATNVVFLYRPLTLCSSSGVPDTAIIDGEGKYRGITWYYPAASTGDFILDGLTISNCSSYPTNVGGGILFAPASSMTGTIRNCIITDNTAVSTSEVTWASGGGIYVFIIAAVGMNITNCVIRNNKSTNTAPTTTAMAQCGGFSINTYGGYKYMSGCLIENNLAGSIGGGGQFGYHNKMIENCVFRDNRTMVYTNAGSGGGAYNGACIFRNCIFYNNSVPNSCSGGAIFNNQGGALYLYNCTIVSNRATWGGAYRARVATDMATMINTIIYSNTIQDIYSAAATNFIYNSCLTNATGGLGVVIGEGIITNNPAFADWNASNYRLAPESPCLNTGTNQDWMAGAIDLDGNRRIRYGTVDMGPYELIKSATIYRFR